MHSGMSRTIPAAWRSGRRPGDRGAGAHAARCRWACRPTSARRFRSRPGHSAPARGKLAADLDESADRTSCGQRGRAPTAWIDREPSPRPAPAATRRIGREACRVGGRGPPARDRRASSAGFRTDHDHVPQRDDRWLPRSRRGAAAPGLRGGMSGSSGSSGRSGEAAFSTVGSRFDLANEAKARNPLAVRPGYLREEIARPPNSDRWSALRPLVEPDVDDDLIVVLVEAPASENEVTPPPPVLPDTCLDDRGRGQTSARALDQRWVSAIVLRQTTANPFGRWRARQDAGPLALPLRL